MKTFLTIGLMALVCLTAIRAGESSSSNGDPNRPSSRDMAHIRENLEKLASKGDAGLVPFMQIWIGKYPEVLIVNPQFKDIPIEKFSSNENVIAFGDMIMGLIAQQVSTVESGSNKEIRAFFRAVVRRPGLFGVTLDYFKTINNALLQTLEAVLDKKFTRRDREAWERFGRFSSWHMEKELREYQLTADDITRILTVSNLYFQDADENTVLWMKNEFKMFPENLEHWPELAKIPLDEFNVANSYVRNHVQLLLAFTRGILANLNSIDNLRAFVTTAVSGPGLRGLPADFYQRSQKGLLVTFKEVLGSKFTYRDREAIEKLNAIVDSMIDTIDRQALATGMWHSPLTKSEEAKLEKLFGVYRAHGKFGRLFEIWFEQFPDQLRHFHKLRDVSTKKFKRNHYIKKEIGPKIASALYHFIKLIDDPAPLSSTIRRLLITKEFTEMSLPELKEFLEVFRRTIIEFWDAKTSKGKSSSSEERREFPQQALSRFIDYMMVKFGEEFVILGRQ